MNSSSLKVTVLSVLAAGFGMIACAAPMEEDVGEDGASAFSEATCKPRADKKKAEAVAQCKKENPLPGLRCYENADAEWLAFQDKLAAARAPYQADIDNLTGTCKSNVDALSPFALVKEANPDYSDAMATIAARDTKEVARLRDLRKQGCEVEIASAIEKSVPKDSEYAKLRDQIKTQQAKWNQARRSCDVAARTAKAANAACTGEDAFDKEMKACRRECPDLKDAACVPDGYTNPKAKCGKLQPKKGLSWQAKGMACGDESETVCERTDVCDKFDVLQRNADSTNAAGGCSIGDSLGSQSPEVVLKDGKASAVKMTCVASTK